MQEVQRTAGRREDVLAAACAVVAERGADATRFSDVTAATGVGVSTLQYYFGSREDMLHAVFRHAARADFDAVAGLLAEREEPWPRLVVIASYLTGAVGSDSSWRLWVESWRWALRDAELRADVLGDYTRWRGLIATEIESGVRDGGFTTKAPPADVARQALALIDGLALPVVLGDPTVRREDARDLLIDALSRLLGRSVTASTPLEPSDADGRSPLPAGPGDADTRRPAQDVNAPVLRAARQGDAPAVAAIWAAGWRDGHLGNVPDALVAARTPESFEVRAAARSADTTVAVVDGVVAGFVMVVGDEVEQVYVDAAFRGGGVARLLLTEAERLVAAGGHPTAWLAVVPGNARARRFYERSGWADAGGFDRAISHGTETIAVPCRRYTKRVTQEQHRAPADRDSMVGAGAPEQLD
ncbi:GNAT family N-acetyltransferase [Actinoplanes sp. M2I2]|uniref:GNAT family N-acetyltransferase n=1 Tax=Actinoplanes sp. M2I2 TaxID=1734444 RepID=UPI0020203C4C|nr:GNAT family N-acetyltransferase [Actinoplanes sp. M2I2]